MTPEAVRDWPDLAGGGEISARRRALMREVFKPAALTADWRQLGATQPELGRDALDGLSFVDCETRSDEASVIALAMREVLERPGRTAALVTPDRQLAEAVIAALQRWRIEVDDSAGRPLSQCPSGGYLESLVAMLAADFAPVPTLAFLKHPLASGGISPLAFRERVRQLEMAAFRGYRPGAGLDGIRRKLASKARYADIAEFFEASIAMPLAGLVEAWQMMAPDLAALARALGDVADRWQHRRPAKMERRMQRTALCICGLARMARSLRCFWRLLPNREAVSRRTVTVSRESCRSFLPEKRSAGPGRPIRVWPSSALSRRACKALTA
ncbi:MAG: hypothetical protein CM15mP115_24180 [Alphaproteobacteria bacterium]|nr:MAG: hypothetical protein CM15mP115_24180 [Alphaproteobacteria bacterium]